MTLIPQPLLPNWGEGEVDSSLSLKFRRGLGWGLLPEGYRDAEPFASVIMALSSLSV